jgi:uncharacterized membrane protein YbhN (UPF0104 family)
MKRLLTPLKILVTVVILILIFKKFQIGWGDITQAIRNSSPMWWLASLGTQFLAILFSIQRWNVLLKGQRLAIPFGHLTSTYMVGRFLGTFTPTGVGLEAYKAYDIARYTGKTTESVAVVFIEKTVVTFLSLSFLVIVSLFFVKLAPLFLYAFFAFFAVLLILAMILLFKPSLIEKVLLIGFPGRAKIEGILKTAIESFTMYSRNKAPLAVSLVFGVLVYLSLFATYYTNSKALRVPEPTRGTIGEMALTPQARQVLQSANIEFIETGGTEGNVPVAQVLLSPAEREVLAGQGLSLLEGKGGEEGRKGLSLRDIYIVGPLTQIATMIPLSIAGIGLREGAFAGLTKSLGIWIGPKTVLTATMWYFVSIAINIIGAILFLARKTDYAKTIDEMKKRR